MRLFPKERAEAGDGAVSGPADPASEEKGAQKRDSKHDFMRRHEEAMEWVLRLNASDITTEERLVFTGWLASDRAHASAFHRAKRLHWMATHPLTPQNFRLQDAPPPQAANSIELPNADASVPAEAAAAASEPVTGESLADEPMPSQRPARLSTLEKLALQQSAMRELTAREARPQRSDAAGRKASKPAGRIVALVVLAGLAAFVMADGPMRLRADLVSGSGEMPRLTLPDGSQVQLDAGSAIDIAYDITERRIRLLRGEAFFQVARDATRPFVVEAQNGTVTGGVITDDSGTPSGAGFDVRLTKAGAVVAVTDQTVGVAPPDKPNGDQYAPVELQAGQRIAYGLDGSMSPIRAADPQQIAGWRQGKLTVETQSLASVVEQLDRHSPTPIIILDNALGQRRISGSFDLTHPRAAIDLLANRAGLRAVHLGPLLTVLRD